MLRIIAGELGGRRLRAPAGLATRPTTDRVREALFNILVSSPLPLYGGTVLDLYAGSGALGIEALSRGASSVVFVEQDPQAAKILRQNLHELSLSTRALVLEQPVQRALSRLLKSPAPGFGPPFDLVVADPPYATCQSGELAQLVTQLQAARAQLLADQALVVIEHASRDTSAVAAMAAPTAAAPLSLEQSRRYGDTTLTFFAAAPTVAAPLLDAPQAVFFDGGEPL